jgi:hypothetical protein
MAFTFLVEDGTGLAAANSYTSVAEADDILAIDNDGIALWDALDDPAKELALAKATRYLDDNYQWFGRKSTAIQALKWPRHGMRDSENMCIADGVIPIEIKRAIARLAVWLIKNNGDDAMNMEGIKSFRSDDVEIEWQAGASTLKAPDFLSRLLITFGWGPNDRGFKPIIRK